MNSTKKLIIIIASLFAISVVIFMIFNPIKSFKIPTASMENTIPAGSRVIVWKKKFVPERFEIVIFIHPDYDTVLIPDNSINYYLTVRQMGRDYVDSNFEKEYVPLKKREKFIGRCVGLPGDTVLIKNADLYVNGQKYVNENIKKLFKISTEKPVNPKTLEKIGIKKDDVTIMPDNYIVCATLKQIDELAAAINQTPEPVFSNNEGEADPLFFPYDEKIGWNNEQYGKIVIPKKGVAIKLTKENLSLYHRLIVDFEGNKLTLSGDSVLINEKLVSEFIPGKNYYFIMGDNVQNSADSRSWGFLPEDFLFAKVLLIW